ncbi:uncharacterized protein N7515_001485 [Penicillium bovifimosum]|uniref:Protein artemis n=1 Tax=Penicillium bovifimosum TaxID=126998 RepID=A0A9W9L8A6_9EURO|nr:uncharacterized protein N7515_001485 [Penicillium bovifimosum]KAJ5142698.1 hypothetical protein N7515_001485 [Penicillium bovifimosum]
MSTFDGIVEEFPDIRIDYFRKSPDRPAPLACFLSHVHSDHLQGLESFRAPFIYCSQATRELLLHIEKYPHRMNFNKGILESRRLHYKHLAKLLRPIPINTPTEIELTPRRRIRVTLFDANHCTGAVMFLIEGDGKAIVYTGDIRSETWWVNSLIRHPILIPYTLGQKRLDKLYLDTTFATARKLFRQFPSKAEGLAELLQKVQAYPDDTVFYFRAWTFGYEDVWVALSAALNTRVHVDRYQMGLYQSLIRTPGNRGVSEAPALCGFELGNRAVAGCLSNDMSSRIHSCEPGISCATARGPKTVYIEPIVNRTPSGAEVPEVGAGGGIGDLSQTHELELPDESALAELEKLCLQHIQDEQALSQMRGALLDAFRSRRKALSLDTYGVKEEGEIPLKNLVTALSHGPSEISGGATTDLPNTIHFPYSRHSSYAELCELVAALRPKDVYPCTVDPATWDEHVSIGHLFGHLCSGDDFSHDNHMRQTVANDVDDEGNLRPRKRVRYDVELDPSTQSTQETNSDIEDLIPGPADATQDQGPKEDPPHPLNQAQEAARVRRNEIRRAHHYLQEHADPELFRVNSLPSNWPTEAEDRFDRASEDGKEEVTVLPERSAQDPAAAERPLDPENTTLAKTIDLTDDEITSPSTIMQQADSQQTDVFNLSVSESAFDSQELGFVVDELRDPERGPDSLRRSRQARVAAYLAAREGTYSAWREVSLVSAGDNHAEEEIEL